MNDLGNVGNDCGHCGKVRKADGRRPKGACTECGPSAQAQSASEDAVICSGPGCGASLLFEPEGGELKEDCFSIASGAGTHYYCRACYCGTETSGVNLHPDDTDSPPLPPTVSLSLGEVLKKAFATGAPAAPTPRGRDRAQPGMPMPPSLRLPQGVPALPSVPKVTPPPLLSLS